MKTILIPTDFNAKSLETVPALVNKYYPEEVNLLLVHMMGITDCERELLMLSRRSAEYRHIPQEFYAACTKLKNSYSQIADIRIDFFYGNTLVVFKNYLEHNEVDAILHIEDYNYTMLNKTSIHPSVLTGKCPELLIKTNGLKKTTQPALSVVETADEEVAEQYA